MFCSTCGFNQTDRQSNFCSGCGRMISGAHSSAQDQPNDPNLIIKAQTGVVSIRKQGLKRGGKMILAGLILVPVFGVLSEVFSVAPVLAGLTALICFWGGFLRMVYAAIFEGNESETLEQKALRFYLRHIKRKKTPQSLPAKSVNFAEVTYGKPGMWRDNHYSGTKNGGDQW